LIALSGYAKKSTANGDTRSGLRLRLRIAAPGPTRPVDHLGVRPLGQPTLSADDSLDEVRLRLHARLRLAHHAPASRWLDSLNVSSSPSVSRSSRLGRTWAYVLMVMTGEECPSRVRELLGHDELVLIDDLIGSVVHLLAVPVHSAEMPLFGEETRLRTGDGAVAGVRRVGDLMGLVTGGQAVPGDTLKDPLLEPRVGERDTSSSQPVSRPSPYDAASVVAAGLAWPAPCGAIDVPTDAAVMASVAVVPCVRKLSGRRRSTSVSATLASERLLEDHRRVRGVFRTEDRCAHRIEDS
jgi:hypothetical protein